MNKAKWLVVVNPVLFFSVLVQIITGVILFYDLFSSRLALISRVHGYNGFLLTCLLIIHILLNWSWIKANFFKRRVSMG